MFSKKESPTAPARHGKSGGPGLSFIGPEVTITGDVETPAALHVEGRIDGHVRADNLCLGEGGTISGDIATDEARIAGRVEGGVESRSLILERSSRLHGDVTYETISIASGAQIEGRLTRREGEPTKNETNAPAGKDLSAAGPAASSDAASAPPRSLPSLAAATLTPPLADEAADDKGLFAGAGKSSVAA